MSANPFNFGPPPQQPPGGGGSDQPPQGGFPFPQSGQPNPLAQPTHPGGAQPTNPWAQQNNPLSQPGAPAAPGGFGEQQLQEIQVAKPPVWLLFVAAGVALAAGIVALLIGSPVVAIICWVLAGPVAIGLIAYFVVKDTYARSSGVYAAPDWVKPLHYATIGIALVCILAPALRIADWVGHL